MNIEDDDLHRSLNLHSVLPRSRANGPGVRFVVWFQGCERGCPGCFNPDTHTHATREKITVGTLCTRIAADSEELEGVTISGGEPFEQPESLLALVRTLRAKTTLSILIFSGFALAEIQKMPLGNTILAQIDVLVDGPYNRSQHLGRGLRGSSNQRIRLLSSRYKESELVRTPVAEITLTNDGTLRVTGVSPPELSNA